MNLIQNISPRNFDRENFQSIVLKCYYYLNNSKKNNKKKVQLENDLVIDNDKVCRIMDRFNTNFLSNETNDDIAYYDESLGDQSKPSQIIDLETGAIIRE